MEDDTDRVLEALKVQIKKEIIDNYFADRVYLEEEQEVLQGEAQEYRRGLDLLKRLYHAFYQALGVEAAIAPVMKVLSLKEWPFYREFGPLPETARQELLRGRRAWGLTAARRYRALVFGLYEELRRETLKLKEQYGKIQTHLALINEDIDKFNLSYDFGLIAEQIEALEGRGEVISGGLLAPEREELSTRMRFKHRKLTDEDLPPLPDLPPLDAVKGELARVLARMHRA
jgi:hypothetical protein